MSEERITVFYKWEGYHDLFNSWIDKTEFS